MEKIRMKPDERLKSYWYVSWALWFGFFVLISLLPAIIMAIVGARGPGNLIAGIMIASWLLVMLPLLAWLPAYYRTLEYEVDDDSVDGRRGVFWKRHVTVPYTKITNIDIHQGPLERKFGLGTIHVQTAGAGGQQGGVAELRLVGIADLQGVKELISERVKGHAAQRAVPVAMQPAPGGAAAPGGDTELLRAILAELGAIRGLLERRGT
jgi:membrane protein YdbS with pleckstrin-like domain